MTGRLPMFISISAPRTWRAMTTMRQPQVSSLPPPSPSPSPSPSPASQSAAAWEAWRNLGSPRYVVAPMVDGSELAFRDLCRKYGANLAYTPMLHSKMFVSSAKYREEHFTTHSGDRPLVAQFCANDALTLVTAAKMVQHAVDAVDLNLGCPQGIAKRGHYGAFLQDEWELVSEMVSAARRELDVPIWCKIRRQDSVQRTVDYARMLERAGASLIAVHARTRDQKGKNAPPAEWHFIRAVQEAVGVPVLANGNVRTFADANEAVSNTGAAGVMCAWALLDNPATFVGDHAPSRMRLAREYLDLAERYATPMRMVRLHMFKMLRGRLDANMDLNDHVARCRTLDDLRGVCDVLSERCDFGDVSFERRVANGEVVTRVVHARKLQRERERKELEERMQTKRFKLSANGGDGEAGEAVGEGAGKGSGAGAGAGTDDGEIEEAVAKAARTG